MAETIRQVQDFSVEVPDKPGEGATVLTLLTEAGVELLASAGFP